MRKRLKEMFEDSAETKRKVVETELNTLEEGANIIISALKKGNKILICGNGGSAADSQHFAAELVIRYAKDRNSLPSIALTTDTSILTACGNDYGFENIFSKQVEGLGTEGDVLIGISTSGNSPNVLKAFEEARKKGIKTICLTGKDGGKTKNLELDCNFIVPSDVTARIQESHETALHSWCKLVDDELFPDV